jgi:transposase InsO family protein
MDGRGRCHDNIFVERLWWTVKHEWVYLRPAANGIEQKRSRGEFFDWYNLRAHAFCAKVTWCIRSSGASNASSPQTRVAGLGATRN